MSLRLRFTLYLVCSHLLFAITGIYLLRAQSVWLLLFELAFLVSLGIGLKLVSDLIGKIELINTGAQFISDGDFTARFIEVGQPEVDRLVRIYNSMIDHLREERTRLEEQNLFLEKLMAASPAGILIMDFDGRLSMINPSGRALLQGAEPALIGRKLEETGNPLLTLVSGLTAGESRVIPLFGRRRLMCHKSQFLDRGFSRSFVIIEELTDEIRKSEKAAYEKLIRLMSHEVNNTVGAAGSLLHSCLYYQDQISPSDRADFENAIKVVISRTRQLGLFMRGFAEIVKLPPPAKVSADLVDLLTAPVNLFKAECAERKIDIVWESHGPTDPVALDRIQMEQVFLNVLKNAIEAIGTNGTITIHTGGDARVVVEDTGAGIAPEIQEHLFTPFFSTKEHGQGIGLTLVREVLEAHGFDYALERQPGQPTRFTIWFQQEAASGARP